MREGGREGGREKQKGGEQGEGRLRKSKEKGESKKASRYCCLELTEFFDNSTERVTNYHYIPCSS